MKGMERVKLSNKIKKIEAFKIKANLEIEYAK